MIRHMALPQLVKCRDMLLGASHMWGYEEMKPAYEFLRNNEVPAPGGKATWEEVMPSALFILDGLIVYTFAFEQVRRAGLHDSLL